MVDGVTPLPPPPGQDRASREQLYGWVYENNQWGRSPEGEKYYSDSPTASTYPYRQYVASFIRERPEIRRVVDLACGDHKVAAETDLGDTHYVGVDIYDRLIEHNRRHYGGERREFLVRDMVEDELPPGDLCLISMALYLMSFEHVQAVLPKLRRYRYVLITDGQPDLPAQERRNLDKPTGKYTPRDLFGNGFYLELEPFGLHLDVVLEYPLQNGELMRTVLLEHPEARPGGRSQERPPVTRD
ncbi:class I SAM-dependent methyltransferase [Streptomyces sp. NBC_01275]|uniref:class I SAM-dependent methyltransferase n=1 Tax=Streptomyces sp. NBC_01275 TaxID=2903807 RepID=UPI002259DBB9|nr:class I SAM-dependent methyltransferase [Streptomyces sp. NBC_01275]MCX4763826.1 class I SAM-dependent methyltransferase [Streptomyces sp. NBC_01275]